MHRSAKVNRRWWSGIAFLGISVIAAAQGQDALPHKLSGRWIFQGPSQTFINPVEMTFEGDGKPGPVTGRVTYRGIGCGAQNEPLTGTWDGRELRITTTHRANVNAMRLNAQCGDGKTTYVLMRKSGEAGFEGQVTSTYSTATATMSVSP
jgi:hypothetical protein